MYGKYAPVKIGDRFNTWTVSAVIDDQHVIVQCQCGALKNIRVHSLRYNGNNCRACKSSPQDKQDSQSMNFYTLTPRQQYYVAALLRRCAKARLKYCPEEPITKQDFIEAVALARGLTSKQIEDDLRESNFHVEIKRYYTIYETPKC